MTRTQLADLILNAVIRHAEATHRIHGVQQQLNRLLEERTKLEFVQKDADHEIEALRGQLAQAMGGDEA